MTSDPRTAQGGKQLTMPKAGAATAPPRRPAVQTGHADDDELAPISIEAPPPGNGGPAEGKPRRFSPSSDELELLIRARYPVLYIVSWEEHRVEARLRDIARQRGKELYTWSVTTGLRRAGDAGSPNDRRGLSDPVEAMDSVIQHKEPAIYLFKDLHMLLRREVTCHTPNIRKVREVARGLTDSYKTMVIVGPRMELPAELEKDVTVVDFPLPTQADLDKLLTKISEDVKDHPALKVDLDPASREALVQAAGGLTLQEAENVFAKTLVNDGKLTGTDVSTVFAEKQQIVRKSGLLDYYDSSTKMEEVGGLENLKDWLKRRSSAFTEQAKAFGLPAPKGVLLVGVQGCGKSLCAKAVSELWRMPLLRFDVGRMFSSLVGSSEENIRRAIAVAENVSPAVLWIDEIDKAFAGSSGSARTDGGTTARVMSTFLTWLSEKTKPVFVIATANDISQLPPELLRKGRLDEIFFVDLPSEEERRGILAIHLARRGRDFKNFDLGPIVEAADGFSGAELEQAVISALYDAFYDGRELKSEDLMKAVRETVPLSKTMSERIGELRAWAAGRARPASRGPGADAPAPRRKLEV